MEKLLQAFINRVDRTHLAIEGIAVMEEGRVTAEHRWAPDLPRNIYSHTKSFMATAVGIAVSEGALSLDDRLADCFPESVPADASPLLREIRLRHLLTMSSGFDSALLMGADRRAGVGAPDYVRYMLSQPVLRRPGELFHYSTADSILAGRMFEQKMGVGLAEFLWERIFKPLGIGYPLWEFCPRGHAIGGGGMSLTLRDMMKLGQLYHDDGRWNGTQLVDTAWVRAATAKQIDTPPDDNVWHCGYGYQFWMSPYPDAYRADGAFGQITTVLPRRGMVVAIQCPETGDFPKVQAALHEEFLSQL